MKKNLKKLISVLLSLLVLMSVMSVGVCAEDAADIPEEEDHPYFFEVIIDIFEEIIAFFKYIFYDVFRGDLPA